MDPNINIVGQLKNHKNAIFYNQPDIKGITLKSFSTNPQQAGKSTKFIQDANYLHRILTIIDNIKNK